MHRIGSVGQNRAVTPNSWPRVWRTGRGPRLVPGWTPRRATVILAAAAVIVVALIVVVVATQSSGGTGGPGPGAPAGGVNPSAQ